MIAHKILLAAAVAAYLYVISPGPAFLALFTLAAAKGRRAGAWFICGHLVGDVTWGGLAVAAILGASRLGSTLFELLGAAAALSHLSRRAGRRDAQGRAAARRWRPAPARDRLGLRPHQSEGLSRCARDVLGDRRALCRRTSA